MQFLLFGFKMVSCTFSEALTLVKDAINTREKKIFIHFNHHNLLEIKKADVFKKIVIEHACGLLDGIAMKIVAFVCGKGWLPDVNGTDLFPMVLKELNAISNSVYLIGSDEYTIKKAFDLLSNTYPGIRFCGYHHGYFTKDEIKDIIVMVNQTNPDLLVLGMGMRKEFDFLYESAETMNAPVAWCVGGLFEFIACNRPRAPAIIRKYRLEWLFRLFIEPRRLFRRYFFGVLKLLILVVMEFTNRAGKASQTVIKRYISNI
jgi:N-acetylglucosaminyldiphosphoundecaprenol N-acetyl-beta-D-mannosaminyltransferase